MPGKRFTAEKIINMLKEAEVLLSAGKTAGEICRELNISEQTYYLSDKIRNPLTHIESRG